jgi:replicative DNA helicase
MAEIHDEKAEQAVLGCLLLENGRLASVRPLLQAEDFHAPAHREIYAAALTLAAEGRPLDHLTLAQRLQERGQLHAVGGPGYLMQLDAAVPWAGHVLDYAATVKDRALRRRLAHIGARLTALAGDYSVPTQALHAKAAQHLLATPSAVPRWKTLTEHMERSVTHVREIEEGKAVPVIPTGVAALDAVIGGWQPTLTILGARTGVGKSAALATFIQNCARAGYRAAVFSLEDEGDWLAWRYLAHGSGVNQFLLRYRKKTDDEWERIGNALQHLEGWTDRVLIDDRPGLTADEIVLATDDAVANHGAQIVFIDHLKEVDHHAQRRERFDLCIEASLQKLRACQKRHGIPFVIAHQMAEDKAPDWNKPHTIADFSDGKVIGKMARVALGLRRAPDSDVMDVDVMKQTNGIASRTCSVRFINGAAMIRDLEGEQQAPEAPRLQVVRGAGYVQDPDEGGEDNG